MERFNGERWNVAWSMELRKGTSKMTPLKRMWLKLLFGARK